MLTAPDVRLDDPPYQGYVYAYPHKTAYRPFDTPLSLRTLWADECGEALFLYVDVPFCEMRCAFCNRFTQGRPAASLTDEYLTVRSLMEGHEWH